MTVNKGNIYYAVCEKIAEISLYDEITIAELLTALHPTFTLKQIQSALVKAREAGWIQYTANQTVCLTYPKGRHVFEKEAKLRIRRKLREKQKSKPTKVTLHERVQEGDLTRNVHGRLEHPSGKERTAKRRIKEKAPVSRSKTPKGKRNPSGRIIGDDWG